MKYVLIPVIFLSISLALFGISFHLCYPGDPNLKKLEYSNGRMTTLQYKDHSYIAWSLGGIIHDPDCKCMDFDISRDKK